MLEFGEKLTLMPSALDDADVRELSGRGFSDREIVAIAVAAAYRNFITRVADGLGVELGKYGDGYYDAQVLRAFGVDESAIDSTLYADRISAQPSDIATAPAKRPAAAGASDRRASALAPAPNERAADSYSAGIRLALPRPMRNLAATLSLKPDSLGSALEFMKLVNFGASGLGRRLESIVGIVTAATAGLAYLGGWHSESFLRAGGTESELRALADRPSGATLQDRERAVARFAEKLTRAPGAMARADVVDLAASGFDDRDVITIVSATAFANFLGRLAAGLCVRIEDDFSADIVSLF